MPKSHENYLVIAISSRALFNLEKENEIFINKGAEAFIKYQIKNENKLLSPGAGFDLVKSFLELNKLIPEKRKSEVIVISKNNADSSIRILKSIEHFGLDISQAAFTSGENVSKYLDAFNVDLFLSASEEDVKEALNNKIAAGLIYTSPLEEKLPNVNFNQIRIAFDGDAVIFSDESELIYKEKGLEAFLNHEKENAKKPLPSGPFAKLLKTLSYIQNDVENENQIIRTALVTSRNSTTHERVIRTLREWKVRIDETFFLAGKSKVKILKAFRPHIFFDDQDINCESASKIVYTAKVPNQKIDSYNKKKLNQ